MADEQLLSTVNAIQLHHAKLLFLVTELFKRDRLTEEQKLSLKFGILNDEQRLMEFYFATTGRDPETQSNHSLFDNESKQSEYMDLTTLHKLYEQLPIFAENYT